MRPGQPERDVRPRVCDVDGAPGLATAPLPRSDGIEGHPSGTSLHRQGGSAHKGVSRGESAMVFFGIDVSKGRLDCAVLAAEGGRPLGRRSFRNDAEGAERAATWATQVSGAAAADTHVILEATAAYHEPVAHRLAAPGMRVSIVNPAQVRSFAKGIGVLGKTDRIDAQLLARYGQLARPRAWLPPARALLDLQGLLARLDDIEADLRREGNRLEQPRGGPEDRRADAGHAAGPRVRQRQAGGRLSRSRAGRASVGEERPWAAAAIQGRQSPAACRPLHGRGRRHPAEPRPQGPARAPARSREVQDGGPERRDAQAGAPLLRRAEGRGRLPCWRGHTGLTTQTASTSGSTG